MILEDIDIHPCLFSEAQMIQRVDFDNGCQLFIPVKSEDDGIDVKQKFYTHFSNYHVIPS